MKNTVLQDFQVFKGRSERTMEAFGRPVMVHHEACLMVRDDQARGTRGSHAMYAIYQRSENRILEIFEAPEEALKLAA